LHLKKLQNLVKNLDNNTEIYFFDESRFGTHSNIGHGWFKKGKIRNSLEYKLGYKNFYLYSSVNPISGDSFSLIMPNVNTDNFNAYLENFSQHLEKHHSGKKVFFIMDGAGWHKSKDLILPQNIEFIVQSPYSPELNPVEKLWQFVKRHTVKNKVFDKLKDIENQLCNFLKNMTENDYKSICRIDNILDT